MQLKIFGKHFFSFIPHKECGRRASSPPPLPHIPSPCAVPDFKGANILGISVLRVTEIRDNKNPLTGPLHWSLCFAENRNDNDPNLFEGDMRLTPEQRYNAEHGKDVDSPGRKRGSSKIHGKWPSGIIVYAIDPTLGKLSMTVKIERLSTVLGQNYAASAI